MLRIDLRAVDEAPVEVDGEVTVEDPVFEGFEPGLATGVRVRGRVSAAGPGRYFWRARLVTAMVGECRRCLAPVTTPIDVTVEALFAAPDESDDPSVYELPDRVQLLDLREPVREELLLAAPPYVVCRDDCAGLCTQCGQDLNTGSCECREAADPRWEALNDLRSVLPGSEER